MKRERAYNLQTIFNKEWKIKQEQEHSMSNRFIKIRNQCKPGIRQQRQQHNKALKAICSSTSNPYYRYQRVIVKSDVRFRAY